MVSAVGEDPFRTAAVEVLNWARYESGNLPSTLFSGSLPGNLPFELPLPPDSMVVGSQADENKVHVIFLSARTAMHASEWFDAHLPGKGWMKALDPRESMMQSVGDKAMTIDEEPERPSGRRILRWYHHVERDDVSLFLVLRDENDSQSDGDVHISLKKDSERDRRQKREAEFRRDRRRRPIDGGFGIILPPVGSQTSGLGGGESTHSGRQLFEVITKGKASTVARHYGLQLRLKSWHRRAGGESGPFAWSFWARHVEGETRQAYVLVAGMPETPGRYYVELAWTAD
jgi:hypothetical protein